MAGSELVSNGIRESFHMSKNNDAVGYQKVKLLQRKRITVLGCQRRAESSRNSFICYKLACELPGNLFSTSMYYKVE